MRDVFSSAWIGIAACLLPAACQLAVGQSRPAARGLADPHASARISAEIRDALKLRKTLVVWLVENTKEASGLARVVEAEIERIFQDIGANNADRLEMAVIAYTNDVKLLTPAPLKDRDALRKATSTLGDATKELGASQSPALFAACKLAIEKFLPYRSQGYDMLFVIAGVNSASDIGLVDEAIVALRRAAVPAFGIGPAIPFGVANRGTGARGQRPAQPLPAVGARLIESLQPERIQLALSGGQNTGDLNDSGFGPFGLERVCRQTGGKFFRQRDGTPKGWEIDPSTGDIKPESLARYAPDYVNEEQYQRLLRENKCRLALHNAALLPPTVGLQSPRLEFPKERDEAVMARNISTAQRQAAERDQPIQRLYDALIAGEEERPSLTGPRWQAGYDLAMGQVLSAKARLDGYNAILATLKQGKSFAGADSKRWVLEPADEIAAGSALDKMAKTSRVYLARVIAEHKGTPWAEVAQRELRHPAGWRLVEK